MDVVEEREKGTPKGRKRRPGHFYRPLGDLYRMTSTPAFLNKEENDEEVFDVDTEAP